MPTTVTKSIGTTGRDYSTVASWEASFDTRDLVANDEIQRGECYADSTFSVAGNIVTISGQTVDATRYVELTTAAGQSFRDSSTIRGTPLRYGALSGVRLECTAGFNTGVVLDSRYSKLSNLVVVSTNNSTPIVIGDDSQAENCFFQNNDGTSVVTCDGDFGASGFALAKNCVFVNAKDSGGGVIQQASFRTGAEFHHCTFISTTPTTFSPIGTGSALRLYNCLSVGYAAASAIADNPGNVTAQYCAFDQADPGTLASNTGSVFSVDTHTQLRALRQAASASAHLTLDARIRPNSDCSGAGSAAISGTPTEDITGVTRADPPTVGAWENYGTWQAVPNGDGTTTGWSATGGSGTLASAIDEDLDNHDGDTSYALSPNVSDSSMFVTLSDPPADFDASAILAIDAKAAAKFVNTPAMNVDNIDLYLGLYRSDETTVMSAESSVCNVTDTANYLKFDRTVALSGTHTGTDWTGARLRLRQDHTAQQTIDTAARMRITAAEVFIDYTPAGGGGGADLVIAAIAQAQSADNLVLTQLHILTLAAVSQAQSGDNIVLTQEHVLSLDNAAQTQSSDNVVLTTEEALQLADASQSQSTENIDLTQQHVLTVADAAQGQSIDNITLSTEIALAIADLLQAQGADNLSITQLHQLIIADLAQAQSVDNMSLTQEHVLAIANALQTMSVDSMVLSVEDALGIHDVSQDQASDNLSLTQLHILQIAHAIQDQVADNVSISTETALIIAAAAHSQVIDNLNLSQQHILTVQDVTHTQTADNLALSQIHVLVIDNVLHAQLLDVVGLTQGAFSPSVERILVLSAHNQVLVLVPEHRVLIH